MKYNEFLENKIVIAKDYGTDELRSELNTQLLDHQRDIVKWSISGGRRAIFASFGLGKTVMQLEIAVKVSEIQKTHTLTNHVLKLKTNITAQTGS
jgi:hypothetical protein